MDNEDAVPSVDTTAVHNNYEDTEEPPLPRGPTDSHVLAQIEQDEKGLAQKDDTAETTDIGWERSGEQIEESLVGGLSNEDLWMLIRRFDKVRQSPSVQSTTKHNAASLCSESSPGCSTAATGSHSNDR